ncbi:unnamed protein product [Brachionus calyciflorus]|uniref:Uncharacterized protein n=1 Tax=Brachionus calyciflorus TaxID=104777 RepID=A0A813WC09_9BILA|nr:unnamed protein product [Brachionus calyciflorus]
MNISIRELKRIFLHGLNNQSKNVDNFNQNQTYAYHSKNSSQLSSKAEKLIINGYLCLHRRNYKTVLVDETDWIYLEFFNTHLNSKYLASRDFLNRLTIDSFNIFQENLKFNSKKTDKQFEKQILYLQIDFSKCKIKYLKRQEISLIENNFISEEPRIFFLITKELTKIFNISNQNLNCLINDTFEENYSSDENGLQYEIKPDGYHYLFKVTHIGPIHSLANSQLKNKLRSDVCIELVPIIENEIYYPIKIILSLTGKFLFYFNLLHIHRQYLLKASNKLENFKFSKNLRTNTADPVMLFFEENFKIIDDFVLPEYFTNTLNSDNNSEIDNLDIDFIKLLKGTLIEKRLLCNNFQAESEIDETLINHYDLILPNKQFKLVIRTHKAENVTIFYDTRFSTFSLNILPGMNIEIYNLIKKSDRIFKASSCLKASYFQGFNFLDFDRKIDSNSSDNKTTKKRNLDENLLEMKNSFTSFYTSESSKIHSDDKNNENFFNLKLLFKDSDYYQDQCRDLVKIYGQIVKIYDLNLKLKCRFCSNLANSCTCIEDKENKFKNLIIDFSTTLLVDDHTSLIKLSYQNSNLDLRSNYSNFFYSINSFLKNLLMNLNEIHIIPVPFQLNSDDFVSNISDTNSKIYLAIKEKLDNDCKISPNQNKTINNSILNSALNSNDTSYLFDNFVKLDIYKTLYDYLYYTILDKHYLFHIDLHDLTNIKEIQYLNGKKDNSCNFKSKNSYNYFKLSDLNSNEQFKSILNLKCFNFIPVEIEFNDI